MEKPKRRVYEPEEDYSRDFQIALAVTLLLFIGVFKFVRAIEVRPYHPQSAIPTPIEKVQELEQIEEPPPPPKPKLPVEVKEAEEEEATEEEEIEFAPTTEFNELQAPPPPKVAETYEFFAVEIKPQVIKRVEPKYPEIARKAGIEGKVFVKVLVDTLGNVATVEILKSTNPIFVEPAVNAAKQWKFKPGYQRDRPVRVWVAIPFIFKISQ
jgi:protein TonB